MSIDTYRPVYMHTHTKALFLDYLFTSIHLGKLAPVPDSKVFF